MRSWEDKLDLRRFSCFHILGGLDISVAFRIPGSRCFRVVRSCAKVSLIPHPV